MGVTASTSQLVVLFLTLLSTGHLIVYTPVMFSEAGVLSLGYPVKHVKCTLESFVLPGVGLSLISF